MGKKITKPRILIAAAKTDHIGDCYAIVKGRNGKVLQTTQIFTSGVRSAILNLKAMKEVFCTQPLLVKIGDRIIEI